MDVINLKTRNRLALPKLMKVVNGQVTPYFGAKSRTYTLDFLII